MDVMCDPAGAAASNVYVTLSDRPSCRYDLLGTVPSGRVCHCCSSIVLNCAPVSDVVQRLFTNGSTPLASAVVMTPSGA